MEQHCTAERLSGLLREHLTRQLNCPNPLLAPPMALYQATVLTVKTLLEEQRKHFWAQTFAAGKKQVYYLSMEFLLGRSLRSCLHNMQLTEAMDAALAELDIRLEQLYDLEPDAGLGNGGLGRLAACYLDAIAHKEIPATGYCILYEFGMFRQCIVDGWQYELPDRWLPGGSVWLTPRPGYEVEVRFGGEVVETWGECGHRIQHCNASTVIARAYDLMLPGYHSNGVSILRVWRAQSPVGMDMDSFQRGDYLSAFQPSSLCESISKALYPNDNHPAGKHLRLRQQYFLCAASMADICRRHLSVYGTLDTLADKTAIHINDTHPALAIPELMRFLMDDCGYCWEPTWDIVTRTFAYTNHTVMAEAMERWEEGLFQQLLPRIYQIVCEINRRFCTRLRCELHLPEDAIQRLSIVGNGEIRMANLAVVGSHSVNGVSELHSRILRERIFPDFYTLTPDKFTSVTNGIASRRWLMQANPALTRLLRDSIGDGFADDMNQLSQLHRFADDAAFLEHLGAVKQENKERFCEYLRQKTGTILNPSSVFDVQVKRLHEYKRQHMNALDIISTYCMLKANPNTPFIPRTYIFGAKAAPGYMIAKQIIRLLYALSKQINQDPAVRDKMCVVFLEEYNVTLSELLMPASDLSEQISLAGTEASGTGNMKLMLGGAVTLGTSDGANVEIHRLVGDENIVLFGQTAEEAAALRQNGYDPLRYYNADPTLRQAVDLLAAGIGGQNFSELHAYIKHRDPFLALADFNAYRTARRHTETLFRSPVVWRRMMLCNIAESGFFCADRAVSEYARSIWRME